MTYDALLAAIATWLTRTDQTDNIPTYIQLLEARLNRELRVREMIGRATASVDAGFADLPSDFLAPRTMQIGNTPLLFVTLDQIQSVEREGPTAAYTIVGNEFQFAPAPSDDVTVALTYYKRLTPVSEDATNFALTYHPDLYLYGALAEAANVIRDTELLTLAEGRFQSAKTQLEQASASTWGDRLTPVPSTVI